MGVLLVTSIKEVCHFDGGSCDVHCTCIKSCEKKIFTYQCGCE